MTAAIEQAKIDAERARRRFDATLDEIGDQLKADTIVDRAWSSVKDKGNEIADGAVEAVKTRPAAAAGVLAAGLLFLARGRIVSTASRLIAGENKIHKKSARKRGKAPASDGANDGDE